MWEKCRQWLGYSAAAAPEGEDDSDRRLAAAVLMAEIAAADDAQSPAETECMARLWTSLGWSSEQAEKLVQQASQQRNQATSLHPFVRLVNDRYNAAEKQQLLQWMWQLALADGRLDKQEEYLLRKISALLYLSHSEYIAAKLWAYENAL